METTKITEINNIIDTYLNFESLSTIDDEQYKKVVIEFFKELDQLKKKGILIDNELIRFISEKYSEISEKFEENPIYEERIQRILPEISEYCSPPYFWDTPLHDYMKNKWGLTINASGLQL
ncbi:hypothetical protein [Chryseobacterium cucumeris]|uniref:hypothetical protein n=1 Tax=Chryseobacterium TaxID=59732 RepID=UPI0037C10DDB